MTLGFHRKSITAAVPLFVRLQRHPPADQLPGLKVDEFQVELIRSVHDEPSLYLGAHSQNRLDGSGSLRSQYLNRPTDKDQRDERPSEAEPTLQPLDAQ